MINAKPKIFFQTSGGSSGIKRSGPTVSGVPQSQIDKLKGTLDHQAAHSITWQDVQAQYAKVGINITQQEAKAVHDAVTAFSGSGYTPMRTAMSKFQKGVSLTSQEQQWVDKYKLCEEWCKVAPTFSSSNHSVIYRGISKGWTPESVAYAQKLMALKVGEQFNLDHMPSSFSTKYSTAKSFAFGKGGIIVHLPVSSLKNSPSIKGISLHSGEDEILVSDYGTKISKIDNQVVQGDGYYHIYVQ